jgi:hypothetical protein
MTGAEFPRAICPRFTLPAGWAAIAVNLLLLALILSPSRAEVAPATDQTAGIEDVVTTRHLIPAGDLYTDGTNQFLCVRTQNGEYALWNPADGSLSKASGNKNCDISSNLRSVKFTLVNAFGYCEALPANCEASFSNARVYSVSAGTGKCGPIYDYYYRVFYSDGSTSEFYLIKKLLKPRNIAVSEWCDGADGKSLSVIRNYENALLNSVDIGDGRTLMYSYGVDDLTVPVLLIVSKLPDAVWSSAGAVFLIPKRLLLPEGMKFDDDPNKPYEAILRIVGQSLAPSNDRKGAN